jgi:hypothetical protein
MGSIGMYLSTQIYSKMLAALPKNPTISETEIPWFRIIAGRARRVGWIKSRDTSQNEGLESKKYSVSFQTDRMVVSYRNDGQHG